MTFTLFSKKNTPKNSPVFNWSDHTSIEDSNAEGDKSSDDSSGASVGEFSSRGHFPETSNDPYSNYKLRLLKSSETLEDKLERLMRNAEKYGGLAQSNYLEQLVKFLTHYPDLVNRVPNNFHSNALELVIKIGDLRIAEQLISVLRANVRPENSHLLNRIKPLLNKIFNPEEYDKLKEPRRNNRNRMDGG